MKRNQTDEILQPTAEMYKNVQTAGIPNQETVALKEQLIFAHHIIEHVNRTALAIILAQANPEFAKKAAQEFEDMLKCTKAYCNAYKFDVK